MQMSILLKSIGQSALIALVVCGVTSIGLPFLSGGTNVLDYRALLGLFAAGTVALTLYEIIFRGK